MFETFLATFGQMVRIIILLALGFAFNRFHLISKTAENVLSKMVTLLFLPCLTLYSYMVNCDFSALVTYSYWTLIGALCTVISMALAVILAPRFAGENIYLKGVYRYALAFPNTGGVATPLILSFFGTAGLFQHSMFNFLQGIMCYTWGIMQLQPADGRHNLMFYLKRIFNANFIAMLIGLFFGLLGAKNWLPSVILSTIDELGSCYVTIALLLTGFSIADYPVYEVMGNPKIYIFSFLRLLLIPVLYLLLMKVLNTPYMLALFVVLSFACPCGMNTVVYPAAYGEDCKHGASMVLVSSLLAVVTVPIMYALTGVVLG